MLYVSTKSKTVYVFVLRVINYLERNGDDKLWSVFAFEEIPERVLHLFSHTTCLNQLQKLRFNVVGATNLFEHSFSFFQTTTFDETVGGVHHQQGSYGQQKCWDSGQPQR